MHLRKSKTTSLGSIAYRPLAVILGFFAVWLAMQPAARAQKTDWDEVRLAQTKYWPITNGATPPSALTSIEERHLYYRWLHNQLAGRGINTYFFRAATAVTDPLSGLGKIDDPGMPSLAGGILYDPDAKSLLVALNKRLLEENIKSAAAMLLRGEFEAKGRTRKLSVYGDNLDVVLVEKEQALAHDFLADYVKRHPGTQGALGNITQSLDIMATSGVRYPPMQYMTQARSELRASLNKPDARLDYAHLQDRINIGLAAVKQMRSAGQDRAQPFRLNNRLDTGIDVVQGEDITFSASGKVQWFTGVLDGRPIVSDPDGSDNSDGHRGFWLYLRPPLPSLIDANGSEIMVNDGTLIGYIATSPDSRSDYFVIGSHKKVTMPQSGRLFLLVNDGRGSDNVGEYQVSLESR